MATNIPSVGQLQRAIKIQEQIEALKAQLSAVLGGQASAPAAYTGAKRGPKPGKRGKTKRVMSPEAREKIAAAQRKRWAKTKRAAKKAAAA